jgi:glutaredoxin
MKEEAEKTEEKKKEGVTIKIPKTNVWMISTIILAIILVGVLIRGQGITGQFVTPTAMSAQDAGKKAIDYINQYLLSGAGNATLDSIKEQNGLYNVKLSISGRQYDSYVTTDGKLFFPSVIDISKAPETPTTTIPEKFEPKKTDKPVAQLYVMSFCPYGIQAEQGMKPVVDLFGTKVAIEPHFIVSVSGDTVNSLHGDYEAKEDMRQACVWKNYGQATFWTYVDYINNNCNSGNIDTCWKDAAKKANVDVTKIENCVKTEGLTLMKAEDALSKQNGVSGSPTLIINGAGYNGARTPEAYKQAICSAFNKQPTECSKTLSTSSGSASSSGGCA